VSSHEGSSSDADRRVVQSVREALSSSETSRQRAVRLGAAAVAPSTSELDRVAFLKSAFSAEPEVARRYALDLARDASYPVRLTAAQILRASRGSEDDLPRLLSMTSRERDATIRNWLHEAIDGLENRRPDDGFPLLLELLGVERPADGLDLHERISDASMRQRFLRWTDKVVARAADPIANAALISACAELAAIILDAAIVTSSDRGDHPQLTPEAVAAIRDNLNGRPAAADLADYPAVRAVFVWAEAVAQLAELDSDHSRKPPFFTTDAERAAALRMLATVTHGWLRPGHADPSAPTS
jgi:hypothetical protein